MKNFAHGDVWYIYSDISHDAYIHSHTLQKASDYFTVDQWYSCQGLQ